VTTDSVLDAATLARLRESVGHEFLIELVDTFLDDAPSQLATLRRAIEQGDADEARRAAHTLKSNGATFGATSFSERCRVLEDAAKRGELSQAGELLARVEADYADVASALVATRGAPS
jgi:HPt (histidine-containing phosphotransfer) domain-containing protein